MMASVVPRKKIGMLELNRAALDTFEQKTFLVLSFRHCMVTCHTHNEL